MPSPPRPSRKPRLKSARITAPDGSIAETRVNEAEWAIGWLRKRRDANGAPIISNEQFAAAERLRADYTLARAEPRLTASWERPVGTPGGRAGLTESERALAAKQRLYRALDAVGAELSGILLEVCCMSAGIEHAERVLGIPQRAGKAILQLALTRLARHYGIMPGARSRSAILPLG
jgi:hypothetical protein